MKISVLAILLSGCAAVPIEQAATSRTLPGQCSEEPVQGLMGRQSSTGLGAAALRLSGAEVLRWVRPGEPVTMDFQTSRLNIEIDSDGRIQRLYCG